MDQKTDTNTQATAPMAQKGTHDDGDAVVDTPLTMDPADLLLERLFKAHATWFDVTRPFTLGGRTFQGLAAYHEENSQYVLAKKAKLWETEQHEHILFLKVNHLSLDAYAELVGFMKTEAQALIHPAPNQMATNLGLVIVAKGVEDGLADAVRKTRFRKNFLLGLKGWSDLRVCVVDLSSRGDGAIHTNAAGRSLGQTCAHNLDTAPVSG